MDFRAFLLRADVTRDEFAETNLTFPDAGWAALDAHLDAVAALAAPPALMISDFSCFQMDPGTCEAWVRDKCFGGRRIHKEKPPFETLAHAGRWAKGDWDAWCASRVLTPRNHAPFTPVEERSRREQRHGTQNPGERGV